MISVAGIWMVYPYKTITVQGSINPINEGIYKPGEAVTFHVNYCKYTKVRPIITRQFVDGVIYTVPSYTPTTVDLGCGERDIQVMIPETLPDGQYKLTTIYRYQMNPLRTVDVVAETEKFTVKR